MNEEKLKERIEASTKLNKRLNDLAEQYMKLMDNLPDILTKDAFCELESVKFDMEMDYNALRSLEIQDLYTIIAELQAQIKSGVCK